MNKYSEVVELVRCKNCMNYRTDAPLYSNDKDNDYYYCLTFRLFMPTEGYCSFNEHIDES